MKLTNEQASILIAEMQKASSNLANLSDEEYTQYEATLFDKGDLIWLERDNYNFEAVVTGFDPDKVFTPAGEYRILVQNSDGSWQESYAKQYELSPRLGGK